MRSLVILLVLAAGCSCGLDHVTLDSAWFPLKRVQKDVSIPAGLYRTQLSLVLTAEPCDFVAHDVVEQNALLEHEQMHAQHQVAMGYESFATFYNNDARFRHDEEAAGWRLEIRSLVQHGRIPDPNAIATVIDTYQAWPSHEDAVAWAASEISFARTLPHE